MRRVIVIAAALLAALIAPSCDVESWPGPDTTGASGTLTPSGSLNITTDDQVVENLAVAGTINVDADGVIIRNVSVNMGTTQDREAIDLNDSTGTLIEDVDITGNEWCNFGVGFARYTARRLEVTACEDGFKASGDVLIEASWVHDVSEGTSPWTGEPRHPDAFQTSQGSNIDVLGNRLEAPWQASNGAVQIGTGQGPIDDVRIAANWMSGGGYTVRSRDGGRGFGAPTNVTIEANVIVEGSYTHGWISYDGSPTIGTNYYDDGTEIE